MASSKARSQIDNSEVSTPSSRNTTHAWPTVSHRHWLRPTLLASVLLLLLSFTAIFIKPDTSLLWRQVPLPHAYRAPLVNCHWPGVVDESYCVFLHQGGSLDKHKRYVLEKRGEADLDSRIRHCFPETKAHGLYYCANDIDDGMLEAIRADAVVDMVECDRAGEGIEGVDVVVFEGAEL